MANRRFTQFYQTLHSKPVQLDCNFVVAPSNGLGITGLKGPGIQNVFMHTSGTASGGNPNPAAGYAIVQFQDNYNYYYIGGHQFQSPNSGTPISISVAASLTLGLVYVITSLGTTTTAQWQTVGVPVGITPAIGVAFVAKATAGSGTGQVQIPAAAGSGIASVDVIGDPNKTIISSAANVAGVSSGAYMALRFLDGTNAIAAPATGTLVNLKFILSNSSIIVKGD